MKAIIAFIGLIAIIKVDAQHQVQTQNQTPKPPPPPLTNLQKCRREVGLDRKDASAVSSGSFASDNRKIECFVKCYFIATGYMDNDGKPQRDVMIKKLVTNRGFKESEIGPIIDECIKEKGHDACETAYKIFHCYRTKKIVKDRINATTKSPINSPISGSTRNYNNEPGHKP